MKIASRGKQVDRINRKTREYEDSIKGKQVDSINGKTRKQDKTSIIN